MQQFLRRNFPQDCSDCSSLGSLLKRYAVLTAKVFLLRMLMNLGKTISFLLPLVEELLRVYVSLEGILVNPVNILKHESRSQLSLLFLRVSSPSCWLRYVEDGIQEFILLLLPSREPHGLLRQVLFIYFHTT